MSYQIKTRLTPQQAQRQLERYLSSRARFSHKDKTHEIHGSIKDGTFRFFVRDVSKYRRAFRPFIIGQINPSTNGSVVKWKYQLDKGEKIIIALWLIPLIILSIYCGFRSFIHFQAFSLMSANEFLISIAPTMMVVLTILWMLITRFIFKEYKVLRGFITETFADVKIE